MSESFGTPEPQRRMSSGMVGAITVAVLVLAVIGASVGYFAAGGSKSLADPGATNTPTGGASVTQSASPTAEPTAVPTDGPTSRPPVGGFALPQLTDLDFQEARRKVRELGLGWRLVFAKSGTDMTVASTLPAAGATVRRGTTVTLNVRGQAPEVGVPGVVGLGCSAAAGLVIDHGLYPLYPTGRAGRVWQQDPEAGMTGVHWNDQVKLFCSVASPGPPTPSP